MPEIILSNDREKRLQQIREKFYRSLPDDKREQLLVPGLEIRAVDPDDEGPLQLEGYAAVFDKDSDGLWFIERIRKGAFADTIKEDDIAALFNHDRNQVLGRNTAETLALEEDKTGLKYIIDLPDTQVGRDLHVVVKRGDVKGSSFSFQTQKDEWEYLDDGETVIRTLLKVKLFDVGPVTFPAYPDTTTAVRSLNDWLGEQNAVPEVPRRRNLARRKLDLAALEN